MKREALEDDDAISGINVTPLVDVCLVLVIIFMVTAPLLSNPTIKVNLPKARTKEGEERDKITITLGKDGKLALSQKVYENFDALEAELKDRLLSSESKLVVIRADQEALHGQLTDIMARAKDAGANSLTIATEHKK